MTKLIKILSILFVILLFITSISLATDINMNLQPDTTSSNEMAEDNAIEETTNEIAEEEHNSVLSNTQSTTVTTVSSIQDEALSLTNILNILLIVVGVVLILLGIAILIRIHS